MRVKIVFHSGSTEYHTIKRWTDNGVLMFTEHENTLLYIPNTDIRYWEMVHA